MAKEYIGRNALEAFIDIIKGAISGHTDNSDIHVTSSDKTAWNAAINLDDNLDGSSHRGVKNYAVYNALAEKVDKVDGKGLSTNDYTASDKSKLGNIENGAQKNVQPDWNQIDSDADDFIKNKPTSFDITVDDELDEESANPLKNSTLFTLFRGLSGIVDGKVSDTKKATSTELGLIKIGDGLQTDEDGAASVDGDWLMSRLSDLQYDEFKSYMADLWAARITRGESLFNDDIPEEGIPIQPNDFKAMLAADWSEKITEGEALF